MEYTRSQLMDQIAVLSRLFDEVFVVDAGASCRLDLETMQPTEAVESVPDLDDKGRAWRPLYGQNSGSMALYWSVLLEHRPCVLVAVYTLPEQLNMGSREASALSRMLTQCHSEMCRDYVTGVYNRSFLDAEFRDRVAKAAAAGEAVSVAMVRVNEYARLCRTESVAAADRCLTTAAGILSLAVGPEQENTPLVRLEDGVFLVVGIGTDAKSLEHRLRDAMDSARRTFSITLARRGEFTATVVSADWAETGSWDWMVSLAEQRLGG